ncbi:MAG: cupin domain-containing protein [Candidatus Doudnabacteria bacterium]
MIQEKKFEISRSKPGRSLLQIHLKEIVDLMRGEKPLHPYVVEIEPGMVAGNHYHENKLEVFQVLAGKAMIQLENLESGEKIEEPLEANGRAIFIPTRVAHAVRNIGVQNLILMVWASQPARVVEDDYEYKVL